VSAETIAALASLLTASAVFLTAWRTGRTVVKAADKLAEKTEEQASDASHKLDEIHVLVNDRLDVALREIALLKRKLGLPVHEDNERK
jgi:hypothetical protein